MLIQHRLREARLQGKRPQAEFSTTNMPTGIARLTVIVNTILLSWYFRGSRLHPTYESNGQAQPQRITNAPKMLLVFVHLWSVNSCRQRFLRHFLENELYFALIGAGNTSANGKLINCIASVLREPLRVSLL